MAQDQQSSESTEGLDEETQEFLSGTAKKPTRKGIVDVIPKKPGDERPRVLMNRGRFGKFKLPASIPLSEMMLPPITKKKTAIYELLNLNNADKYSGREIYAGRAIDPRIVEANKFIDPPPFGLTPTYTIFDRFEPDLARRNKVMKYVTRASVRSFENPVTKQPDQTIDEQLGEPGFINGQVVVEIENNYPHYVWWELHPQNASNKWRPKERPPVFKRIDIEYKSPHQQMMKMDLQQEAERYVIGLRADELINLASAMTNPVISTAMPPNEIRLALRLRARNNPEEVLFKAPNPTHSITMNVISAMDLGIIDYRPETNEYFFASDDDKPMFVVPLEQTPIEALAGYLSSAEGKEDRKAMENMLSFWV